MAQHDMNIANQGFPATRADINNALQALVTNSSGTSAPSTTFANQWWYDTTNNKMYIRNEANNAWIEVAVLDQTNNEWQITTGVVQAKDSDGLALKTDDGTTRLFIKDSDGSIGLGTTSPDGDLHVYDSDGDCNFILETGTNNSQIGFADSASNFVGKIQYSHASNFMGFTSNGSERMRILSGGGLTFNGDTAAVNALNDYEEGTWTPNVQGSSTAGSFSGSNIVGWYTKVGDMVTAWFDADGTVSGASGNIEITGLPFTSLSGGPEAVGVFMRDGMQTDGTAQDLTLYLPQGQSYMNIFQSFDNAAWTVLGTTNETIGIRGNITYKTA